jgi:hypothetical protein
LLLPFVSLLGVLLFYGTLALLFSMLLPARRLAAMAAGMLLAASYFLTALAQINSGLKPIAHFSPLEYYQSGYAIQGLKLTWLGGLLAASALFTVLAGWRFERRDIRVGGEGNWRWPWPPNCYLRPRPQGGRHRFIGRSAHGSTVGHLPAQWPQASERRRRPDSLIGRNGARLCSHQSRLGPNSWLVDSIDGAEAGNAVSFLLLPARSIPF